MTATSSGTAGTRTQAPSLERGRSRRVFLGGVKAGAAALVAIELYALVLHATGVPLRAGALGAHSAKPITYGSFAVGVLIGTFWGTIVALVVARYSHRPVATFVGVAAVATAASLLFPLGAGATPTATKVVLALGHLLAAGIMVPVINRHLAAHGPRNDVHRLATA
jgi:hypothetical protein